MESVVFGPRDQVLAIRCVDGRTEAPVYGVLPSNLHQLRLTGGILAPRLGARDSPDRLLVYSEFFFGQVMDAIAVKNPVAIIVVTHADCGAAKILRIDDGQVADYLEEVVKKLVHLGVTVPIYGAHDQHCLQGIKRVFERIFTANARPKILLSSAAA